MRRKEKARDGGTRRGPREVQLRLLTALTFDGYVPARVEDGQIAIMPALRGSDPIAREHYLRKRTRPRAWTFSPLRCPRALSTGARRLLRLGP